MKILFIGHIVGSGLDYLETHLPELIGQHQPDFIVASAENLELSGTSSFVIAGMSAASLARLRTLGVDAVTGGNHSWDSIEGHHVHSDPHVLRPLNYGMTAPGRGATILYKGGLRLRVVNLASYDTPPFANDPQSPSKEPPSLTFCLF